MNKFNSNKVDLSVVFVGRDDDYGKNFIDRFYKAQKLNIENYDKYEIDYEIIVVDYNPINKKYLFENNKIKNLLSNKRVKNIIVDNSIIKKEKLNTNVFYEFFAKNVGCRHSNGNFILLTNSDIIFSEDIIKFIKNEMETNDPDSFFYRVRYRGQIEYDEVPNENSYIEDLNRQDFPDHCVCGYYSGDATLMSRELFCNVATGYNEKDMNHRNDYPQSGMDGEILWNLYKRGKKLKFIEFPYYHINHERPNERYHFYMNDTYENDDNWGCVNYKKEKLNHNTIIITSNLE